MLGEPNDYPDGILWPLVEAVLQTRRAATLEEALDLAAQFLNGPMGDRVRWNSYEKANHGVWPMLRALLHAEPGLALDAALRKVERLRGWPREEATRNRPPQPVPLGEYSIGEGGRVQIKRE